MSEPQISCCVDHGGQPCPGYPAKIMQQRYTYVGEPPVTRAEFTALTQRVAALDGRLMVTQDAHNALVRRVAALEAASGPRLCPDCFVSVGPGHVCKTPYREWCSACNDAHAPDAHTLSADPPAAPSLLPSDAAIREAVDATENAWATGKTVPTTYAHVLLQAYRFGRDARLRALAEAVVRDYEADEPTTRAVQALAVYLRETAR